MSLSKIDILTEESLRNYVNCPIYVFNEIDSTNSFAKRIVQQGQIKEDTLIVANYQTSGRGRKGHSFYSPSNSGIYMTIIFRYTQEIDPLLRVTPATAVAVCESIEEVTNQKVQIKWVNDIFLDNKKISGILTETILNPTTNQIDAILVGIGINCFQAELPDDIKNIAGFLNDPHLSRTKLIGTIWNKLNVYIKNLKDPSIMNKYQQKSMLIGKRVTYELNHQLFEGTVHSINDDGHLVIQLDNNDYHILHSGEVSIKEWKYE